MKEISSEIIYLFSLQYSMGDRIALLLDPSIQSIPLGEVNNLLVLQLLFQEFRSI